MESNPEIELAEQYANSTCTSIFLTGKAGTGKTTFLHHLVATVKKRAIVVAPTGVAAVNAGGVTIHSFFQLPLCPYLPDVHELVTEYQMPEKRTQLRKSKVEIIRTLELLIIDEISMVRADLLDAVDYVLRRYRRNDLPFGGVQLLMIGDVQQLPPVVTDEERPFMERVYPSPFFFNSKALKRLPYVTICLKTIYRQQDLQFVELLNNIRENHLDNKTLAMLNARLKTRKEVEQEANECRTNGNVTSFPILLTTHNYQADQVNNKRMADLSSESRLFEGGITGNFPEGNLPADLHLTLKVGAQVMFVKNDSSGAHRYYNGKIAKVSGFEEVYEDGGLSTFINVTDDSGSSIRVGKDTWENIRYEIDSKDNQIKQTVDGTYTQYPLRLAWAITIHKSQGLTFDRVVVDAHAAFTYGQVYVALSRCRSLDGLTLISPISSSCVFDSAEVNHFNEAIPSEKEVRSFLSDCQKQYLLSLLDEMFECTTLQPILGAINRLYQNELKKLFPAYTQRCVEAVATVVDLTNVAVRFHSQIQGIVCHLDEPSRKEKLAERILKGAQYFYDKLAFTDSLVEPLLDVDLDNKELQKSLNEAAENLRNALGLKLASLEYAKRGNFTVEGYQKVKTDFLLNKDREKVKTTRKIAPLYADNAHPKLIPILSQWRKETAAELDVAAFHVITQKTLLAIADRLPKNEKELLSISGIGKVKVKMFGQDILRVLADYCAEHGIEFPRNAELNF